MKKMKEKEATLVERNAGSNGQKRHHLYEELGICAYFSTMIIQ